MRSLATLVAAVAAVLPVISAAPEPGTVQFNYHKRRAEISPARLARRQTSKTVNAQISNGDILYLINVTVGTPPQKIGLQLDTGSSDIWIPASDSQFCQQAQNSGCPFGSYDSSASSSYSDPGYGTFKINYVDGTAVEGNYISDTLTVGGATVNNLTMASASQTGDQGYGIMGVGFSSDESALQSTPPFQYPNIIDVLVSQGKINKRSYSLWLDDLASNTGSILFGGVDKNKYTGSLIAIPIQKDSESNNYTSFSVAWTSLVLHGGGKSYDESPSSPQSAILDSGTTDTLLPDDIANNIFNGVGVVSDRDYGNVVGCNLANDDLTFSFQFGGSSGPTVNVSLSEFVTPLLTESGRTPKFTSGPFKGQDVCSFGIEAAGQNPILFGDTFLRSAYVVYDLDNLEIGLAQTNFNANADEGSVVAFASGSGMPDATATVTSVVVAATSYDGPQILSSATATGDLGDGATTRSATFSLSTSTSTSSSSSSNAAAPSAVPSIQRSTIAAMVVTLAAFIFGTMLL